MGRKFIVSSDVVNGMSMVWVRKMVTFFNNYDVDKRGVISLERLQQAMMGKGQAVLKAEQLPVMAEAGARDWQHFFARASITVGDKCRASWADFIEDRFHAACQNRDEDERKLRDVLPLMFALIDANHDGTVTLEEHHMFTSLWGFSERSARVSFSVLDEACTGAVSLEDWINRCVLFFYSREWDAGTAIMGRLDNNPIEVVNTDSLDYRAPVPRKILRDTSELWVRKMLTYWRVWDVEGAGYLTPDHLLAVYQKRVRHRVSLADQQAAAKPGEQHWAALWQPAAETKEGKPVVTWQKFLASRHHGVTVDRPDDEKALSAYNDVILTLLGIKDKLELEDYLEVMGPTGLSKHTLSVAYTNMDENADGDISLQEARATWLRFFHSFDFDSGTFAFGILNSAKLEIVEE